MCLAWPQFTSEPCVTGTRGPLAPAPEPGNGKRTRVCPACLNADHLTRQKMPVDATTPNAQHSMLIHIPDAIASSKRCVCSPNNPSTKATLAQPYASPACPPPNSSTLLCATQPNPTNPSSSSNLQLPSTNTAPTKQPQPQPLTGYCPSHSQQQGSLHRQPPYPTDTSHPMWGWVP